MAITRWKLTLEYKGTDYCGWQRQQSGVPTIQQVLEDAIYAFCQQQIRVTVAGRTDAGVHAVGQVVHFDLDYGARNLRGYDLAKALNAHMRPHPVSVVDARVVAGNFNARFGAVNKLYRYRIVQRPSVLALEQGLVWHYKKKLDVEAMQRGAAYLLGKHDFSTFRDSQCQAKSPIRTLDRLDFITRDYDAYGGREIIMEAEAQSFLHHQIRNFVGTLALVGEGKWAPQDVKTALEKRDRTVAGQTAPPDGLYLVRIDYESDYG